MLKRLKRLAPTHRPAPVAEAPAITRVHSHDVLGIQAALDQPLRRRGTSLLASPPLRLAPLLIGDPPVELRQGRRGLLYDDATREVQQLQT